MGRPVPGLEVLVINGPQPLAICLPVLSPIDQEILESLARLPELPAAELTGHRGGDCGPGRRVPVLLSQLTLPLLCPESVLYEHFSSFLLVMVSSFIKWEYLTPLISRGCYEN